MLMIDTIDTIITRIGEVRDDCIDSRGCSWFVCSGCNDCDGPVGQIVGDIPNVPIVRAALPLSIFAPKSESTDAAPLVSTIQLTSRIQLISGTSRTQDQRLSRTKDSSTRFIPEVYHTRPGCQVHQDEFGHKNDLGIVRERASSLRGQSTPGVAAG